MGENEIQIVRLAPGDVRHQSDYLKALASLVLSHEVTYPGIEKWWKSKVLPGIKSEERIAFIGVLNGRPVASAVLKKGRVSKFCHLKIQEDLQEINVGEMFFSLMAVEMRQSADVSYFTLPESLWQTKGRFFQSFGFERACASEIQYRLFDKELISKASFQDVWLHVLDKIPKLATQYSVPGFNAEKGLLMSVRPEYAEKIISKKKTVEIRKKFSRRWIGQTTAIYATAPTMALLGEATIQNVRKGSPEKIWERFSGSIGCAKEEFFSYCSGSDEVFAIEFTDVCRYRDLITLRQAEALLCEDLIPPQSYLTLESGKSWAKAINLAAYLHSCIRSPKLPMLDISKISTSGVDASSKVRSDSQPDLF